jgi:hypothetical protein
VVLLLQLQLLARLLQLLITVVVWFTAGATACLDSQLVA